MTTDKKRALITEYKTAQTVPLVWLTNALGLSRNGWYHPKKPPDYRAQRQYIETVLTEHPYYGYKRVTKALNQNGITINHKTVYKIMGYYHLLQIKKKRTPPKTTNSNHRLYVYQNEVKLLETVTPGLVWVSDITYIPTDTGWVYLALVMDQATKHIVGWEVATTMHRSLCLSALRMALQHHHAPTYHHSDRGVQYCSHEYITELKKHGITPSMADVGLSVDNPYAESLNRSIKVEEVYRNVYRDISDTRTHLSRYISVYNTTRLHSSLGFMSPIQFEAHYYLQMSQQGDI